MHAEIHIQQNDFDQAALYAALSQTQGAGAVVSFTGLVREFSDPPGQDLWLEHYPGMTEKILNKIAAQAAERWPILKVSVVHRVGRLAPGEQIVFVGVAAGHRQAAFAACAFVMDFLKTEAPFWKKEGSEWVAAKPTDQQAADAWRHRAKPFKDG